MPVIRPFQPAELEDFEPYEVTLKGYEWGTSSEDYGSKPQLVIDWQVSPDDPDDTVRDYVAPSLGTQRDGKPSKLTQLLNAIAGQPASTKVMFFVTETLEFGYSEDTTNVAGKIAAGAKVILRGSTREKKNKQGTRFAVETYQMVRPAGASARRTRATSDLAPSITPADSPIPQGEQAQEPVAAGNAAKDDEIPF